MGKYVEKNLGKDEEIIGTTQVHKICLLPHILLCFVYVGFFTIWGAVIRICTTDLAFTNKRLLGKVGLINTKVLDTPLNKINNVSVEQGLCGKIFGYGTIVVSSSSAQYNFKGIKNPETFRNRLMEQIDKFDDDRIKKQAVEMAKAMRDANS